MNTSMYDRLRQARNYLGLSQEYVAKQLGLNRTAITAIEAGERNVSSEELKKFSELYGLSLDELAYGEDKAATEVSSFARGFAELSEDDKREIQNLVDFKIRLKKMRKSVAE